jgi:hypothetical protein
MQRIIGTRLGAWLCLVALAASACWAHGAEPASQYGKVLYGQWNVPRDTIEKMLAYKGTFGVLWSGPQLDLKASGNPYTIVIKLTATAKTDGDVTGNWQAGWGIEDKGETLFPVIGLHARKVKAGDPLVLTAATPTSMKEDRKAAPVIRAWELKNVDIAGIEVSLYSGMGKGTWRDSAPLWGGIVILIFLGVWWFLFRRG